LARRAPSETPARWPLRAAPRRSKRRRWLSPRDGRRIAGALAATVALALLLDRGPPIAEWVAATVRTYAADATRAIDARLPDISPARIASDGAAYASDHLRALGRRVGEWRLPEWTLPQWKLPQWKLPAWDPPDVSAAAPERLQPREAPAPAPIPPPAPIRVAVNSDPWSHVQVDGAEAGPTPLMIELAPGPHRFRAAMSDGRVIEKQYDVSADRNRIVLR
jgi:hypothetical protein